MSAVRPVRPWPGHFFCHEIFLNYPLPFKVSPTPPLRQHFGATWPDHFSKADYGPEDAVAITVGRLKMRNMKMRDQFARVENAGKVSMESQSVKKCLKVVVFVCRVIPSV